MHLRQKQKNLLLPLRLENRLQSVKVAKGIGERRGAGADPQKSRRRGLPAASSGPGGASQVVSLSKDVGCKTDRTVDTLTLHPSRAPGSMHIAVPFGAGIFPPCGGCKTGVVSPSKTERARSLFGWGQSAVALEFTAIRDHCGSAGRFSRGRRLELLFSIDRQDRSGFPTDPGELARKERKAP